MTHEPIRKALYIYREVVPLREKQLRHARLMAECTPNALEALLADLDRVTRERDEALKDARRYRWLRGNVGELSTSAFEDMQFYGAPDDLQDAIRLDAAIDAALGDVGV